jgi:hypothetical protein
MNKEIENFISKYSVRIKIDNTPNGSAVIIPMPSENYDYIITAKHCLVSDDVLLDNISIDFWNTKEGKFHETPLNIDNTQILFRKDENLDLAIIVVQKVELTQFLQEDNSILISSDFSEQNKDFFFRGFPKGMDNEPHNQPCQYSGSDANCLKLSASRLETNDTGANANADGFSGSGVWFKYQSKFYLSSIVLEFNKALPTFNTLKISKVNEILGNYSEYKNIELTDVISQNKLPTLLTPITKREDPKGKFNLHFRSEFSSFIGRTKEMEFLRDFTNDEGIIKWTYIVGRGGIGKSRLLLEFSKEIKHEGWEIKYSVSLKEYNHNNIANNTFFIIDSENITINAIKEFLSETLQNDISHKVRIVFISRFLPLEFIENIIANPVCSLHFFGNNDEGVYIEGLNDSEYITLIRSIIDNKVVDITIENDELIHFQKKLDPFKRPIFAILIGLSLADNEDISNWITTDLLNYYYSSEYLKCKEIIVKNDILDKHLNLIALLFIIKKPYDKVTIDILDLEKGWLPNKEEFNENFLLNFFEKIPNSSRRESIYPDIIANYFILRRFSILNDSIIYGQKEIIEIINWIQKRSHSPIKAVYVKPNEVPQLTDDSMGMCLFNFNRLILQDFPEHDLISIIIEASRSDVKNFYDGHQTTSSLIVDFMRTTSNISKLYAYERNLSMLDSNHNNVVLNVMRGKYELIRNGLDIDRCYSEIRKASDDFEINPWDGNMYFAKHYVDENDPPHNFYEEATLIQEFAKKEKDNNKEIIIWVGIPHVEAEAIEFIILNKLNISIYTHKQLLDRLSYLSHKWTDPEIRYMFLNVLADTNLYSQSEIINKFNTITKELLRTPKQVHRINVSAIIVDCFFVVIRYFYGQKQFQFVDYFYNELMGYIIYNEINKKSIIAVIKFMRHNKSLFDEAFIAKESLLCKLLFQYSQELKRFFPINATNIKDFIIPKHQ